MLFPRSDIGYVEPSLVPAYVAASDAELYGQMAITSVLLYDTITTMDKEVKYIWSSPRSSLSLVYFCNRYIGVFAAIAGIWIYTHHVNETLCQFSFWARSLSDMMTILFIDYILCLRVMVLFSRKKSLTIVLGVLFALEAAFMLSVVIYSLTYEQIDYFGLTKGLTLCGLQRDPAAIWLIMFWVAPLALEVVLMALALYKAADYWKTSAGFAGFGLVNVLIQDQAFYFVLVIACSVTKIVALQTVTDLLSVTVLFEVLGSANLLCVLGSWLLIHLREASEKGVNGGTSYRMETISDMRFM